jgi:hypothetical protein
VRLLRLLGAAVEWLDVFVLGLIVAAGIGLVVVLVLGGGTVIEVGLIVVATAAAAVRWLQRSWAGDKLRGK